VSSSRPFHKRLNQLREQSRRGNRHGSCGMGVGAARELHLKYADEVILVEDLRGHDLWWIDIKLRSTALLMMDEIHRLELEQGYPQTDIVRQCEETAKAYCEWPAQIVDRFTPGEFMVFEGAQGVLLDETHGDAPYNTWTDTTFRNADTLLDEAGIASDARYRLGCTRTYHTRHGAGPFPCEDAALRPLLPEPHNATDPWQGEFRVGPFDFALADRAHDIVGHLDGLAVSHLDCQRSVDLDRVAETFAAPIVVLASGPSAANRWFTDYATGLRTFAERVAAA
jgi:adenylosuccinate synthase